MGGIARRFLLTNWSLLGVALLLFAIGILNLYSAGGFRLEQGMTVTPYYQKQAVWGSMGLLVMLAAMVLNYRHFHTLAWPLFWLTVGLLALVLITGSPVSGCKRWLSLGFCNIQPSEIAKVSLLFVGARYLSREPGRLSWMKLIHILALGMIPVGLVVVEPDLGTGLSLLLLLFGMVLYRGVEIRVLKTLAVIIPVLLPLGWFILHDYQKQRILTFLDPGRDPLGAGYHIIQSQIAIGSGMMWGKGFLSGTQSQLRFLPEKHTDFALAVFGEEWGFIGTMILLALFCLFLHRISVSAREAKDRFGSFLCVGVFFYFFWQVLINMGMVLGLMPVVGMPLPFVSYGGSSTLVNFCLIGVVLNVSMRRFLFKKA